MKNHRKKKKRERERERDRERETMMERERKSVNQGRWQVLPLYHDYHRALESLLLYRQAVYLTQRKREKKNEHSSTFPFNMHIVVLTKKENGKSLIVFFLINNSSKTFFSYDMLLFK